MRKRAHEEPQRGNVHRLTIKQHVFPAASIARFAGDDGRVAFYDLKRRTSWRPPPDDQVFCARRVWDQRAEAGYMRAIEDAFQALAKRVIADPGAKLAPEDDSAASHFFALWRGRAVYRSAPDGLIPLNGVKGDVLTKDQEELLESRWTGYIRAGGVPARQMYGLSIQRDIDALTQALGERRWGVLALIKGELIVPDVPDRYFIPLTPTLCLAWGHETGRISGADARLLNQTFMAGCEDYWFCRALPCYGLETK
jgi:hypothetical protein